MGACPVSMGAWEQTSAQIHADCVEGETVGDVEIFITSSADLLF